MKKINLIIISILTAYGSFAQIATGTINPDASSALDLKFIDRGVLLSRVSLESTTDITTIDSPANSLIVYNTTTQNDVTPGFYYWNNAVLKWIRLIDFDLKTTDWSLLGNGGTISGVDFIGTTDDNDVVFKRNNLQAGLLSDKNRSNAVLGNTSFGVDSYKGTEEGSLLGRWNTSIGYSALSKPTNYKNSLGNNNTAIGSTSLKVNYRGSENVAVGSQSLIKNIDGNQNTSLGYQSLSSNTNGNNNIAIGSSALRTNQGNDNVAIGAEALLYNTTGESNTAIGKMAIYFDGNGKFNTGVGQKTLAKNNSSNFNTALGIGTLSANIKGSNNTAVGGNSGLTGTDLDNTTAIGYFASVTTSNTMQFGNTSVKAIMGQVPFSTTSDQRYKKHIKTIPLGLDFINKLRPVEYVRKNNEDKTKEWGVIAQELQETLEQVHYKNAGIVQEDGSDDKMLSVRYTDLIAPMTKAIQELTEKNKKLKEKNEHQKNRINKLQLELKEIKNLLGEI